MEDGTHLLPNIGSDEYAPFKPQRQSLTEAQFDEEIAKHYFVTGKRGEPKRITLSRDLVEWE